MSDTSSINSSVSKSLLPVNQESQAAQPLPTEVVLLRPDPEEETLVLDVSGAGGDGPINVQAVMDHSHFKVPYPRKLLDLETPEPVGENIMVLVLRHACITGCETSLKHGKKRVYLDNLHSHAFNEDRILNQ